MPDRKRISAQVPDWLYESVGRQSRAEGKKPSALIRDALVSYIRRFCTVCGNQELCEVYAGKDCPICGGVVPSPEER